VFDTVPEKEHVFAINGMGSDVHQAFTGILFKPWTERHRTQQQILQELQPKVASIAGGQIFTFGPPSLPGSTGGPPVQFVITTTADYEQLAQVLANMQQEALKSGLFIFTDSDLKFDTPQVEVKIDHDKANRLGIVAHEHEPRSAVAHVIVDLTSWEGTFAAIATLLLSMVLAFALFVAGAALISVLARNK